MRAAGSRSFPGRYRGTVTDNVDPLMMGRILSVVPEVQGAVLNWAKPCARSAEPDTALPALPPVGAAVWIEFEDGDPNYPIWGAGTSCTEAITPLETDRLILMPLTAADAPALQAAFPVWEVVRWMGAVIPWPYPEDGAETFLTQVALPAMAAGKAWHWSVRRKAEPGQLIGVVSLTDAEENNRGFWIDPVWQGQGFATEASGAATDYWFEVLRRTVLRVPKAIANPASRRVSEKQGMRVIRRLQLPMVCGVGEAELWEIDRETWRREAGGRGER